MTRGYSVPRLKHGVHRSSLPMSPLVPDHIAVDLGREVVLSRIVSQQREARNSHEAGSSLKLGGWNESMPRLVHLHTSYCLQGKAAVGHSLYMRVVLALEQSLEQWTSLVGDDSLILRQGVHRTIAFGLEVLRTW